MLEKTQLPARYAAATTSGSETPRFYVSKVIVD